MRNDENGVVAMALLGQANQQAMKNAENAHLRHRRRGGPRARAAGPAASPAVAGGRAGLARCQGRQGGHLRRQGLRSWRSLDVEPCDFPSFLTEVSLMVGADDDSSSFLADAVASFPLFGE